MTLTPALPRPALRPSESPCIRFGKKKLMFDMEDAKAPAADARERGQDDEDVKKGVSGSAARSRSRAPAGSAAASS